MAGSALKTIISTENETDPERLRLIKVWQRKIDLYEDEEVECTRDCNIGDTSIKKGEIHKVVCVKMYLSCVPIFILEGFDQKQGWHPDKFKLVNHE